MRCYHNHTSRTINPINYLSLPLKPNPNEAFIYQDLSQAIDAYFAEEVFRCFCPNGIHVQNNRACNAYRCDSCNAYGSASRHTYIVELPNSLVIHLLLFTFVNRGIQKIIQEI